MRRFTNLGASNIAEAVALLQEHGASDNRAYAVGAGTDLLVMIKDGLVAPDAVVDLKGLGGLDTVQERTDGVRVGGLITLDALGRHPLIRSRYTVLAEAAETVATPQIRNVGTLAGNVCQRPWCWYLRQGFPCLKNGGNMCYSVVGENQFNAIFAGGPSYIVHPSDTAPALVSLKARFRVVGPAGERMVPADEFFVLPRRSVARENVLAPDEILAAIELPSPPSGLKSSYTKFMDREAWTHAVVSVAVALEMDGAVCTSAGLTLGGVAPVPWRLPRVEAMLAGQTLTPALAAEAGKAATAGARPLSKNAFKVPLTETLVRRSLTALLA